MVYFNFETNVGSDSKVSATSTSSGCSNCPDCPESTESSTSTESDTLDPDQSGLVKELVDVGETMATIISPWTSLLTAIVQAFTVWKLVGEL